LLAAPASISDVLQSQESDNPNEFPLKVGSITPARGQRDGLFLFVFAPGWRTYGHDDPTFSEYVAMREGMLSPTRPPLEELPRLNTLPTTDVHRKCLHLPNPAKAVTMLKPTVRHVIEIVPQNFIPKLPPPPRRLTFLSSPFSLQLRRSGSFRIRHTFAE
jgi:hypothetical protein